METYKINSIVYDILTKNKRDTYIHTYIHTTIRVFIIFLSEKLNVKTKNSIGEAWPEYNSGLKYKDKLKPSHSGLTVIEFYSLNYANSAPLQGWLQRIQNGQIAIDGIVVTDPTTIIRAGSEIVYHRLRWKEPDAPYMLEVLYEDDDMIALNKPSGLQVLPGGSFQQRTVLTQLQWRTNKHFSSLASNDSHAVPVHRLGRGTSGILLCAKTKLAKTCLSSYFADGTSFVKNNCNANATTSSSRKIVKIYRALIAGVLEEDEVIIKQPIGLVHYPGVAKGLYVASASGKPAVSKVKVLQRNTEQNCTLVEVEIQSGRPHQIRIHLSFIGYPLIGDPLYIVGGIPSCFDPEEDGNYAQDGGYQRPLKPVPGDCGYHLHACEVILSHPTTNEIIRIVAPVPPTMRTHKESELKYD